MHTRPDAPPVMVVEKHVKGGEAPLAPAWPIQIVQLSRAETLPLIETGKIPNRQWGAVCWSPELKMFCAVSENSSYVAISQDGLNWREVRILDDSYGFLFSICWSSELHIFCAMGGDSEGKGVYATSNDGVNWNWGYLPTVSVPGNEHSHSNWAHSICWAPEPGLFCAAAGLYVFISRDGKNWSAHKTGLQDAAHVCWSSKLRLFLCVGGISYGKAGAYASRDGKTWNKVSVFSENITEFMISRLRHYSLCWSPELGLFCVLNSDGTKIATSHDARNWTIHDMTSLLQGGSVASLCWSPGLGIFLALGVSDALFSVDGQKWTMRNAPGVTCRALCWSPELKLFCVVGYTNFEGDCSVVREPEKLR